MKRRTQGFTIIELMIVVVIIGIVASIAMPSYQQYMIKSYTNACLMEAKSYSNAVFLSLNDQDIQTSPPPPTVSACASITDASLWKTEEDYSVINAIAKKPSEAKIQCILPKGVPCYVLP